MLSFFPFSSLALDHHSPFYILLIHPNPSSSSAESDSSSYSYASFSSSSSSPTLFPLSFLSFLLLSLVHAPLHSCLYPVVILNMIFRFSFPPPPPSLLLPILLRLPSGTLKNRSPKPLEMHGLACSNVLVLGSPPPSVTRTLVDVATRRLYTQPATFLCRCHHQFQQHHTKLHDFSLLLEYLVPILSS